LTWVVFYEQLEETRDRLGLFQDDYNQAEESFDWQETRLNARETRCFAIAADAGHDFTSPAYQNSSKTDVIDEYLLAAVEAQRLKEDLYNLRMERDARSKEKEFHDTMNLAMPPDGVDVSRYHKDTEATLNDKIEAAETEQYQLRQELLTENPRIHSRRASECWIMVPDTVPPDGQVVATSTQSESAVATLVTHLRQTEDRVMLWLFDLLVSSPIERARNSVPYPNNNNYLKYLVDRFPGPDDVEDITKDSVPTPKFPESTSHRLSATSEKRRNFDNEEEAAFSDEQDSFLPFEPEANIVGDFNDLAPP
ncbi:MAG: hypothetical protein Q9198_005308, partial [Flavoplaca austrocitrina]